MTYSPPPAGRFTPVHEDQHPDGPKLIITRRNENGLHSFRICKVYADADGAHETTWFSRRHIQALRELLDRAEGWLDQEVDRVPVPRRAAGR